MESYDDFVIVSNVTDLEPRSPVEEIERVARLANSLPHWFDQRRATLLIAKHVNVEVDLIHRLMTRQKGGH